MAREWVKRIEDQHGVSLPLLDEHDTKPDLLATQHLVVFGGSHQNRLALDYTDSIFSDDLWRSSKQCENSRSYEPLVFEHAAAYSAFTGRGLALFDKGCFEKMVERQIATTDNFFRLVDYGGVNWFRTAIVLAGHYVLILDRIQVIQSGLEKAHVEWNALGQAKAEKNGFRLEQKGVFMDVTSASGWHAEQMVADQSACWKDVLEGGSYPYATFPLAKLVFHLPDIGAGQTNCLGTLIAATRAEAQHMISQPEQRRILVAGPHKLNQGLKIEDMDLTVHIDRQQCEVRFDAIPEIPAQLANWSRGKRAKK